MRQKFERQRIQLTFAWQTKLKNEDGHAWTVACARRVSVQVISWRNAPVATQLLDKECHALVLAVACGQRGRG